MKNEMNIKSKVKRFWILSLIFITIQILIEKVWRLKLLILGVNGNGIKLVLLLILLISPICFFNYNENMGVKKTYRVISIMCVLPILFVYMFLFAGDKYFYFTSPYEHSKRVLIAEESAILFSGSSSFYERKYVIFIKPINGYITTDDGFRPFSCDAFTLKWLDENSVQLDYSYGSNFITKTEIIRFK